MDKLLEARLQELERGLQISTKGRSVPFYANVAPLDIVLVTDYCPVEGRIRQVTISWPDGCNFLVLVAFGREYSGWLVPAEHNTFERNNDTPISYPLDEPVSKRERLWLRIKNGDSVNSHQISATVTVIEVTPPTPTPMPGVD